MKYFMKWLYFPPCPDTCPKVWATVFDMLRDLCVPSDIIKEIAAEVDAL